MIGSQPRRLNEINSKLPLLDLTPEEKYSYYIIQEAKKRGIYYEELEVSYFIISPAVPLLISYSDLLFRDYRNPEYMMMNLMNRKNAMIG